MAAREDCCQKSDEDDMIEAEAMDHNMQAAAGDEPEGALTVLTVPATSRPWRHGKNILCGSYNGSSCETASCQYVLC